MIFYVTFGQSSPFRDGWVEIEATDQFAASATAREVFESKWASVYSPEEFKPEYFPQGKLGRTLEGAKP